MTVLADTKISAMQEGGKRLGEILHKLIILAKPGVHTRDLDAQAERLIIQAGGKPSFKTVHNYSWSTCMCVNDEVVHGIPDDVLQMGDILGIDVGMIYQGYHTDTAWSVLIGDEHDFKDKHIYAEKQTFLRVGKEALLQALQEARVGRHIGHISQAIQTSIESAGYSIVRSLVGHGVGRELHEDPEVPGFLSSSLQRTPLLSSGQTIAVEVIYAEGKPDIVFARDGWTIRTKDGSCSGLFEQTIAITKGKPLILTPW